ncbi:unnamed protein product [Prunus armeniaca]
MAARRLRTKLVKFLSKPARFRVLSNGIRRFRGRCWSGKEEGEVAVRTGPVVNYGGGGGFEKPPALQKNRRAKGLHAGRDR